VNTLQISRQVAHGCFTGRTQKALTVLSVIFEGLSTFVWKRQGLKMSVSMTFGTLRQAIL
jgi:hypothetical protein